MVAVVMTQCEPLLCPPHHPSSTVGPGQLLGSFQPPRGRLRRAAAGRGRSPLSAVTMGVGNPPLHTHCTPTAPPCTPMHPHALAQLLGSFQPPRGRLRRAAAGRGRSPLYAVTTGRSETLHCTPTAPPLQPHHCNPTATHCNPLHALAQLLGSFQPPSPCASASCRAKTHFSRKMLALPPPTPPHHLGHGGAGQGGTKF